MSNGLNPGRSPTEYTGVTYNFIPAYAHPRDPTGNDLRDPLNQGFYKRPSLWINTTLLRIWILLNIGGNPLQANWVMLASGAGAVEQFTTDDALTEVPTGTPPNINIFGKKGIDTSKGGVNEIDINLPNSIQGQVLTGIGINAPIFSTTVAGDGSFTYTTATTNAFKNLIITTKDTTNAGNQVAVTITGGGTASGAEFLCINKGGATTSWALGMPMLTQDNLVIHTGTTNDVTPNTGTAVWSMNTSGARIMPKQPAFLLFLDTTANNKTGNGATYTLGTDALVEVYDQGTNSTTAGVFTAPVTGIYDLRSLVTITGTTIATTFILNIVIAGSSAATYSETFTRAAGSTDQSLFLSTLAKMTATDTATVTITVSGEAADTADIKGGATLQTYFCGALIC